MSVVDQVGYYYALCTCVRTKYADASGVLSVGVAAQQCAVAVPIHPVNGSGGCLSRVGDSVDADADADAANLGASQPLPLLLMWPRGLRPFDICVPVLFVINHYLLSHRPPLPATTAHFKPLAVNPEY